MRHSLLLGWLLLSAACGGSTESELGSSTPAGGSAGSSGSSAGSDSGGVGGGSSGSSGQGGSSAGAGGSGAGAGGSVAAGSGGAGGSEVAGAGGANTSGAGGSEAGGAGGSEAGGAGGSEVAGSGGAGNAAGSAGAADCVPPSDPSKAALCVTFAPEEMDFVADDPQLDGQGILYLAAYDTPFPDNGPGEEDDAKPLAAGIYPAIQGPEPTVASVTQLPMQRLDNLPSTVYLRALFFDNLESLEQKNIAWGVWIGGLELSGGIKENLPLNQQALTPGKASSITLPLNALRRLEVSVKLKNGTKPLDEGSGPFSWFAFHEEILSENMPLFGIGDGGCLKLGGGETSVVRGFVTGPGDHYVVGNLNDYNNPGGFEGGDILNVEGAGGALKVVGAKLSFGPKEYRKTHNIELSLVIPLPPNTQNPAPYICP